MNDFLSKDNYNQSDIENLIDNEAEENINLDFKDARGLGKEDKKKDELAKDVSAFANSDGGIIVYGIEEKNHKADKLSFINGNIFTKEWLEQVINSRIHQKIEAVRIYPIRFEGNMAKSIYVVKIPSSSRSPHQASDRKYYRRYNFESVPMEEYEVRNLYARILPAKLDLLTPIGIQTGSSGSSSHNHRDLWFTIDIGIKNVGNSIEKEYKLETILPSIVQQPSFGQISNLIINHNQANYFFSIPNQNTIFQKEIVIYKLRFKIIAPIADKILLSSVSIKLYFSSGLIERTHTLKDILKINGRSVELNDFQNK